MRGRFTACYAAQPASGDLCSFANVELKKAAGLT